MLAVVAKVHLGGAGGISFAAGAVESVVGGPAERAAGGACSGGEAGGDATRVDLAEQVAVVVVLEGGGSDLLGIDGGEGAAERVVGEGARLDTLVDLG